jgi:DNA-binding SARP family transcriptional activator
MMFRLRVLGGLDLRTADGRPVEALLRQPKRLAVLVYLACARPRGYHRRQKLAALFWPELPEERARAALRTTLSRLRDDLGEGAFAPHRAEEVALVAGVVTSDLDEVEARLAAGEVRAASAAYHGAFLDGVHVDGASDTLEDWIAAERLRIRHAVTEALDRLAAEALAAGRTAEAIAAAREAVTLAPTEEGPAQRLIGALLVAGDRAAAVRAYEELAARLARAFEMQPSAGTRALVAPLREEGASGREDALAGVDRRRRSVMSGAAIAAPSGAVTGARSAARTAPRPLVLLAALGLPIAASLALFGTGLADSPAPLPAWHPAASDFGIREARIHPAVVVDSSGDALVVIGGLLGTDPLRPASADHLVLRGFRGGTSTGWTRLRPAGEAPSPRWQAAVAYDRHRDRAVMFGGARGTSAPCSDETWVVTDPGGLRSAPRWHLVRTRGPRPPARALAAVAYDPAGPALLAFGGNDCIATHFSDLWRLRFDDSTLTAGRWERVAVDPATPSPATRSESSVGIDVKAGRLILHGGTVANRESDETWVLSYAVDGPARWTRLRCTGTAPAVSHAGALYDAATQSLLLVGGRGADGVPEDGAALLRLTDDPRRCRWTDLAVEGRAPVRRIAPVLRADPRSREVILFGGLHLGAPLIDVWRLDDPFRERR